jgi:hypothetical protein
VNVAGKEEKPEPRDEKKKKNFFFLTDDPALVAH